jgi:uncharacterized sulfatase
MREGDWKLLCEYDGSKPQLYNLAADRGETTNLAAQQPGIVTAMVKALRDWHQSMPPDNGAAIGVEKPGANSKTK